MPDNHGFSTAYGPIRTLDQTMLHFHLCHKQSQPPMLTLILPSAPKNIRIPLHLDLKIPQLSIIYEEGLPLPPSDKSKLLYHVNRTTGVQRLYILPSVVFDILVIAHRNEHPSFLHCYEIITCSWFIQGLTKML